jgi:hypothetical protein
MAITEWGKIGELEKGEVIHVQEEAIVVRRWRDAELRIYYYKVSLQCVFLSKDTH